MNTEVFTLLNDINVVKEFINRIQTCEGDVDVTSADKRYTIDAKSIMGIFSLDLSKPVCIIFHEEKDYDKMVDFITKNFKPSVTVTNKP